MKAWCMVYRTTPAARRFLKTYELAGRPYPLYRMQLYRVLT